MIRKKELERAKRSLESGSREHELANNLPNSCEQLVIAARFFRSQLAGFTNKKPGNSEFDPKKLSLSFCFPPECDLVFLLPTQFSLNATATCFGQPLWEHLVQLCTRINLIFDCLSAGTNRIGLFSLLTDLPPVAQLLPSMLMMC